jgi:Zn-dependent peptidase ImmA (M78 family)/DNA-binding XRE family transcriptional regulator
MSAVLDHIAPTDLGERLRIARETAKVTQAAASAAAGMARTTLVAIEQGQRRIRLDELQGLARLYGTSVNAVLRREAVHVDLMPRFRKLTQRADPSVEAASQLLTDLVEAEVELENLLGVRRVRNYPHRRTILPGDVQLQAEQDALEVRQWLGLGLGPVPDMVTLLDLQLGVRVFVRKIAGRISGLFAFDEAAGACMLLNAEHPLGRRMQTAAHELGHLLVSRGEVEVLVDGAPEQVREERYASAFARGFLMPARSAMQQFHQVTAGASHLTRRHVIVLAHAFNVSREAIVRRLEELKLAKAGTWDWFADHGGITDEQERQVLGELAPAEGERERARQPTSLRLDLLAAEAWKRELLSEGQLARLLRLDRVALRMLLDRLVGDDAETEEALELRV